MARLVGGNKRTNGNEKLVWLKNLLITLMAMFVQLQLFHFLHKIHSNALLLGEVVLGGNRSNS